MKKKNVQAHNILTDTVDKHFPLGMNMIRLKCIIFIHGFAYNILLLCYITVVNIELGASEQASERQEMSVYHNMGPHVRFGVELYKMYVKK